MRAGSRSVGTSSGEPHLCRKICWRAHLDTTRLQAPVQLARKLVVRRCGGAWEGADHHHALSGQQSSALTREVAQSPLHQVPGDGDTDGLGHHEAHSGCDEGTQIGALGRRDQQVDHDQWATAAPATAHDLSKVKWRGQTVTGG